MMISTRCTTCGVQNIEKHIFRGRNYCKEHYEMHIEMEKDSIAQSIKGMQDTWDMIKKITPDEFDEFMRRW